MGAETAPKRGRPTDYDDTVAAEICRRIAEGESLRAICLSDDMPARSTVFLWLRHYGPFSDHYARAREDQAESLADEVMDTALNKDLEPNDRRVRIDALKWLASKRKPKVYGDKVVNEHTGKDGGPIQSEHRLDLLNDEQLAQLNSIHAALAALGGGESGDAPTGDSEGA